MQPYSIITETLNRLYRETEALSISFHFEAFGAEGVSDAVGGFALD